MAEKQKLEGTTVKWNQKELDVYFSRYEANGAYAIHLKSKSGTPYGTATICVPDFEIDIENEAFIKGWTENRGLPKALKEAGIISEKPKKVVEMGFVDYKLYDILKKPQPSN